MEENRLWQLIARHLSGEITADETKELEEKLRLHPDKQYLLDIFLTYFDSGRAEHLPASPATFSDDQQFQRIISKADAELTLPEIDSGRSRLMRLKWAAAAAFLICIGGALTYYYFRSNNHSRSSTLARNHEIISRSGAKTKLTLPDGSLVWLNGGSKLKYADDFGQSRREVDLEGEAYFDVVKDISHPFIVHAFTLNIEVLGTVFDVKSYPQDETVEATLIRGSIEVSRTDNPNAPKVLLRPNEKLTFSRKPPQETQDARKAREERPPAKIPEISVVQLPRNIPDSNKAEVSWIYNRLVFDGDNFRELADKMERWYNVKISFVNEDLMHIRFKGAFANESVTEALDALKLTAEFNYQVDGNEIKVYRN